MQGSEYNQEFNSGYISSYMIGYIPSSFSSLYALTLSIGINDPEYQQL